MLLYQLPTWNNAMTQWMPIPFPHVEAMVPTAELFNLSSLHPAL